jgi:hypothetical protein
MSVGVIAGNVAAINLVTVTWDIPSIAANTTEEETFTLNGVKTGDLVYVSKADLDAGILFGSARVTAANTVGVQLVNATGSAVDAASETVKVLVVRPEGSGSTKLAF